jgi:predicted N-acetyltransferase YhbS
MKPVPERAFTGSSGHAVTVTCAHVSSRDQKQTRLGHKDFVCRGSRGHVEAHICFLRMDLSSSLGQDSVFVHTLPSRPPPCACGRRQGIGKLLLKQLLNRAGETDVVLTTISSRIKFYADEGFERLSLKEVPRWGSTSPLA